MATLTLIDYTDTRKNIEIEDGITFADALDLDEVQSFFENSDADEDDDIEDHITAINDVDVEDNNRLLDMLLRVNVEDGNSITFDFIADDDDEDDDSDDETVANGETAHGAVGARGSVTVELGGGLQTVRIEITNGSTTVREAVYNDTVRRRSGMNDSMLDACTIRVVGEGSTGEYISGGALDTTRLTDSQIIEVNQKRVAATKG